MQSPELTALPPPPADRAGWPWTTQGRRWSVASDVSYPRITIVTPSFNQGEYLEAAIRSVLLQGYPNLEYIVIDSGSSDNSVEIIQRYQPWISYWVSEPDGGQSAAINKGFAQATGAILGWLNSDDMYCENALHEVGRYWSNAPSCNFLTGDGVFVDASGLCRQYYVKSAAYPRRSMLRYASGCYLPQPSVFFSAIAFNMIGEIREDLHYAMYVEYWFRLRDIYHLHYLPRCLAILRKHADAKGTKQAGKVLQEVERVVCGYIPTGQPMLRLQVALEFRRLRAGHACRRSLDLARAGARAQAFGALFQALYQHPAVVLSRPGLQALAHSGLPLGVRSRLARLLRARRLTK